VNPVVQTFWIVGLIFNHLRLHPTPNSGSRGRPRLAYGIQHIFDHDFACLALVGAGFVFHDRDAMLLITAQPGGDGSPGKLPGISFLPPLHHTSNVIPIKKIEEPKRSEEDLLI
jgi:hypothetical protein